MRRVTGLLVSSIACMLLLASAQPALAAPGDLDPSFGNGGKLPFNPGGYDGGINAMAIQPNEKIVVAGYAVVGPGDVEMAISRLNPNGSADQNFGSGGTTLVNYNGGVKGGDVNDIANAVALQPDGKIVIAGQTSDGSVTVATVVRLNSDGSLDTSFQDPGVVSVPGIVPFRIGYADAVVIDQSGGIVFAGGGHGIAQTENNSFVDRLHSDGSTDDTFDYYQDLGADDSFNGLAVQPDGKTVAVGSATPGLDSDISVVRLLDSGQPDPNFGTSGTKFVETIGGADDFGNAVAVQADGMIDIGGSGGSTGDMLFARLTSSGQLDPSLNGGQPLTIDFGSDGGEANAITLLANGKIVLAGDANNSFAVVRLQPGGTPDSTFASGGKRVIQFTGENSFAYGVAAQTDGKIVLAGIAGNSAAIVRLLGDPANTGGGPGGGSGGGGHHKVLRCAGKRATIIGTNGNDKLKGTRRADVIVGLGGNDTISGLGGNDVICGGAGKDKISGGAGKDKVFGGAGNDKLGGGSGKDQLNGGPGNDALSGGPGKDKLNGGPGRNTKHQ